jgi:hypothetical protein
MLRIGRTKVDPDARAYQGICTRFILIIFSYMCINLRLQQRTCFNIGRLSKETFEIIVLTEGSVKNARILFVAGPFPMEQVIQVGLIGKVENIHKI